MQLKLIFHLFLTHESINRFYKYGLGFIGLEPGITGVIKWVTGSKLDYRVELNSPDNYRI